MQSSGAPRSASPDRRDHLTALRSLTSWFVATAGALQATVGCSLGGPVEWVGPSCVVTLRGAVAEQANEERLPGAQRAVAGRRASVDPPRVVAITHQCAIPTAGAGAEPPVLLLAARRQVAPREADQPCPIVGAEARRQRVWYGVESGAVAVPRHHHSAAQLQTCGSSKQLRSF